MGESWAHPRSRGENIATVHFGFVCGGSSPLTRGKRASSRALSTVSGLIPAHAGKTARRRIGRRSRRAHPRSRGENGWAAASSARGPGSSPLTRGKLSRMGVPWLMPGLIPAHAGKTVIHFVPFMRGWAHPRSRGENRPGGNPQLSVRGSSPLTRGKRRKVGHGDAARGLIPAHAGKTPLAPSNTLKRPAHPRSRGENIISASPWLRIAGSSPLTRGKRRCKPTPVCNSGLIPAHAGKTNAR